MAGPAAARRRDDDRGAVAATALMIPLTFLLFLLVIQISLWFYGRMAVGAAAQHGLEEARVASGTPASGEAIVRQFLDQVGGVEGYELATVSEEDGEVTVLIEADPHVLLDAMPMPALTVEVSATKEQVVE
jgi:hypothetical protein